MPEIHRDLLRCIRCDKDGDTIKRCAKCLSVSYCGRECQVADWPRHKRLCLPVMIKDFGDKGRGLVASRDFKVGDLIFNDKLLCSTAKSPDGIFSNVPALHAQEIHAQILNLTKKEQEEFFELSESKLALQAISDINLSMHPRSHIPTNRKKAYAIFFNNKFGDVDRNHLSLNFSLLNHSCDPNSYLQITDDSKKMMELRAIKEIKKGDEITASYLDFDDALLEEKFIKQTILIGNWNFKCKCPLCLQPEDDRIKDLRKEFKELKRMKDKLPNTLELVRMKHRKNLDGLRENAKTQEKYVDFIIKLDNPLAYFSSWTEFRDLPADGELAGRHDLVEKGMKLLKECSEKGRFIAMSNHYKMNKQTLKMSHMSK